jgi:hypothetical protein
MLKERAGSFNMTAQERLAELVIELRNGKVVEARLRADGEHVDGYCDFGSDHIYVDPRPAIVSTLIHELLHRRWKHWSERRVRQEERRILAHMTPDEVSKWFRMYTLAKRTRKTTRKLEDSD